MCVTIHQLIKQNYAPFYKGVLSLNGQKYKIKHYIIHILK